MDTLEEKELWKQYVDPMFPDVLLNTNSDAHPFIQSVSTFQRLCSLSKIMTQIINKFYVVGATAANARANLHAIDESLNAWKKELPAALQYDPSIRLEPKACRPTPNLLQLHCLYYSMIILLHRPLLSDGHLRTAAAPGASWRRCSEAARNITSTAQFYQASYSLRGGPYILAYALYVACTIHVRNAAALEIHQGGENSSLLTTSLQCMEELTVPNPGVIRPVTIIRNLVAKSGLNLVTDVNRQRSQDAWDIDVDEILRMFPSRSGDSSSEDYAQMRGPWHGNGTGFEQALHEDVLYGFMDGQAAAVGGMPYDLGTSLFGMEPL